MKKPLLLSKVYNESPLITSFHGYRQVLRKRMLSCAFCRLLALSLIVLTVSCKNEEAGVSEDAVAVSQSSGDGVNVHTALVQPQEFQKQIISNGKIVALQKSELRFKTSDRISSIRVRNGDKVTAGQVIAVLDNELLKNRLESAVIQLEKAKNQLREEKINFSLENTDSVIEPAVLKNLQIKSGYLEAENELENIQLLLDQTILKAPFTGVVANIETKPGDFITTADVFCTVIAPQNLEVSFSLLEGDIAFLENDQEIRLSSFANPGKEYKGRIIEINPLVDENGLIKVKAKVINPDQSLFDGMNVKVIINSPIDDVVVIPKEALVLRSNREVIFTVENGLAQWNYVDLIDENSTSYAIKGDPGPGDTIVVSNNMNLSHEARVNAIFLTPEEAGN